MEENVKRIKKITDKELMIMDNDTFESLVLSFQNVQMTIDLAHAINSLKKRYFDIHNDSKLKKETTDVDCILTEELGLTDSDFNDGFENISDILLLLNRENFDTTKKINIVSHQAFPGIKDLGSPLLSDLNDEFVIKNFEELVKALSMVNVRDIYDINEDWMVNIKKPSLSDCICFREDCLSLDDSDIRNSEFQLLCKYLPKKNLMIQHAKMIIALAKVYLNDPYRYYKAYISTHKNMLNEIDLNNDLVEQLVETKDINKETMLIVLIDSIEHGYSLSNVIGE